MTAPGLAAVWNRALGASNRWILNEDRSVVEDQEPRATHLHRDERLVPSDAPILRCRTLRERRREQRGPIPREFPRESKRLLPRVADSV